MTTCHLTQSVVCMVPATITMKVMDPMLVLPSFSLIHRVVLEIVVVHMTWGNAEPLGPPVLP